MVRKEDSAQSHIAEFLRKPAVQKELVELLAYYYDEVHYISDIAGTENHGIRPTCLENEIYSCMHHIARGLASCTTEEKAISEIRKGKNSHLKRLHFDAYKIAINSFLSEYADFVTSIRFLVLQDSFKDIAPDGVAKATAISELAVKIKNSYLSAKKNEALGVHDLAKENFNNALCECYDLREKISDLTKNSLYCMALALEAKKQKEEKRNKQKNRMWECIFVVAAAILSALCTKLFS